MPLSNTSSARRDHFPHGEACGSQFRNTSFREMCSGSKAGSYLRLIDFVHHSTLGLSAIKKKGEEDRHAGEYSGGGFVFVFLVSC